MKMATLDGRLDLRELEPLAAAKFDKRAMTTRWPSMFVANTYTEFAQRLFDRLGIGAGGNGARALRLLARIQAGQQVRTVDGLYKAMVLEQPATYMLPPTTPPSTSTTSTRPTRRCRPPRRSSTHSRGCRSCGTSASRPSPTRSSSTHSALVAPAPHHSCCGSCAPAISCSTPPPAPHWSPATCSRNDAAPLAGARPPQG